MSLKDLSLILHMCACMWVRARECRRSQRPAEVLDFPEAGVQVAVSHQAWVLGTELGPSAKTVYALNP